MTTCSKDWLFSYDYTWEGWEDDFFRTIQLQDFVYSKIGHRSLIEILERDLGRPAEIDMHFVAGADPLRGYGPGVVRPSRPRPSQIDYAIKINGEIIIEDHDAAVVLMHMIKDGLVPPEAVAAYRVRIGLASKRSNLDFRPVYHRPVGHGHPYD